MVPGVPVAKGSFKAMRVEYGNPCYTCKQRRQGHPKIFNSSSKTKPWEKAIASAALLNRVELVKEGCVIITMKFYFTRPKYHAKMVDPPMRHTKKPDVDKLSRTVLDALKGIAYKDDCQAAISADKWYANGSQGYVEIEIHDET